MSVEIVVLFGVPLFSYWMYFKSCRFLKLAKKAKKKGEKQNKLLIGDFRKCLSRWFDQNKVCVNKHNHLTHFRVYLHEIFIDFCKWLCSLFILKIILNRYISRTTGWILDLPKENYNKKLKRIHIFLY